MRSIAAPDFALRLATILSAVIPIAYVLALPPLSRRPYSFAEVPCPETKEDEEGKPLPCYETTISKYISNAHATGAMAAVFFPAQMLLWYNTLMHQFRTPVVLSLLLFQIGFSAFLACNVTWKPHLHTIFVNIFALAGIVHFVTLLPQAKMLYIHWPLMISMALGAASFAGMILLSTFHKQIQKKRPNIYSRIPSIYWALEVCGLAAMVTYVPLLMLLRDKRTMFTLQRTVQSVLRTVLRR